MALKAITISRQLGSLGNEVARAIAAKLDYRVVCTELINLAARRAGAPEVALATIDDLDLLGLRPSLKERRAFQSAIVEVMGELVSQGKVVIVGRAGQAILRGNPHVFHIKVISPAALRARRVSAEMGISLSAATAQIETSDRSRQNYLRRYYRVRWDDPELYDLILNTARLSPHTAAGIVTAAFEQCQQVTAFNGQP